MTNQKYIEEIRKACVKANPEIMELKFGCQVEVFIPPYEEGYEISQASKTRIATFVKSGEPMEFLDGHHIYDVLDTDFKNGEVEYTDEEDGIICTIIGRPITLADVLLAIWSKDKNGARALRQHTGNIADGGYKETILERIILLHWNLKETLENQSEETIEWLYKLIKE